MARQSTDNQPLWDDVDSYIIGQLLPHDPTLDAALAASAAARLPAIQVAANQGKLLHLLARIRGARRILEIGTLGGYSTIWLARALPADGRVITLELDPKHAAVARRNFANAGVAEHIDLRVGRALDELPKIAAENAGPFDLVFIDADKPSIPEYWTWALRLTARGSVIIIDNVIRDGGVIDPKGDASIQGVRRVFEMIGAEPRVSATALQTVGGKGYDGLAIALVIAD